MAKDSLKLPTRTSGRLRHHAQPYAWIVVITEGEAVEGKGKAFDYRFIKNNRPTLNDSINLNNSKNLGSNALPIRSGGKSESDSFPSRLGSPAGSLPAIIQNYKSITSRMINKLMKTPGSTIWHRNYYEHIIRDEADYTRIVTYIQQNPQNGERES